MPVARAINAKTAIIPARMAVELPPVINTKSKIVKIPIPIPRFFGRIGYLGKQLHKPFGHYRHIIARERYYMYRSGINKTFPHWGTKRSFFSQNKTPHQETLWSLYCQIHFF